MGKKSMCALAAAGHIWSAKWYTASFIGLLKAHVETKFLVQDESTDMSLHY